MRGGREVGGGGRVVLSMTTNRPRRGGPKRSARFTGNYGISF